MNISEIEEPQPRPRSGGSPGRDTSGYRVRGERVPSVTEVIEIAGLSDIESLKRKAGADVVEKAAVRGTIVHGYCEVVDLDDQYDLDEIPEAFRGYVKAYKRFRAETGFEPIYSELCVASPSHGFAGTLDRLGIYPEDGRVALIDLKTPAQPSPTWAIQTAGYAIAVEDAGVSTVDERSALRLRPNGTYKLDPHHGHGHTHDFLAALRVAHFRLAHGLAHLED